MSIKDGSFVSIARTIRPGEKFYFYKSFTVKKSFVIINEVRPGTATYEFIDKGELVQDTPHPKKVGAVLAKGTAW